MPRGAFERPITVMSALQQIRERRYLLPAIQRRFVWSSEKVEALFDSLMRGYPISSFMFWKITDPQVKNTVRFYDFLQDFRQYFKEQNALFSTRGHSDFFAVIDGQQRLTALYIGVFGSYAYKLPRVWLKNTEENMPTRRLYLNLCGRRPDDDEQGMLYDFQFLTETEARAKGPGVEWFRVSEIVDYDSAEKLDEYLDERVTLDREARRTLRILREALHEALTINFYVEPTQDIDHVLDVFIRTNSGGVPLSYSDLLMSNTTAQWKSLDARAEFDKLAEQVFGIGRHGFVISKDFILKTGLALFGEDVRFRLANLNAVVIDQMESNWARVARTVLAAFEFLADLGFHEANLRAKIPVIPIVQYVYLRGLEADFTKPQKYEHDKTVIRTWLCMSVLKGVFRSQTDHLLNALRRLIKQGATATDPHFPLDEIRAAFQGQPSRSLSFDDAFVSEMLGTSINDPAAFPLLTLIYSGIDYSRQRVDIDHLHPAAQIARIKSLPENQRPADWAFIVDEANWNTVANLQPLNDSLNRSKQDQPLAEWVAEKKIDPTNYLLPPDVGLDIGSFRPFIEARRVLLAQRLRDVVGESSASNRTTRDVPT